ncbi:MAG: S8 family serine peptidase [Chloroflexi bacterium]|nr:S8 family serine peptidase [Chloroflexota bacterium]
MKYRRLSLLLLLILPIIIPSAPASAAPPPPSSQISYWRMALGQPHVPQEILVFYNSSQHHTPASPAYTASHVPGTLLNTIPQLNLARYRIRGDMAQALARLNQNPAIAFAEPNYLLTPDFDPNDPYYQNYAANDAAHNGGYLNRIHIAQAWDITRGNPAIIVAVIDSGIDLNHEDLKDALWTNPAEIADNGIDDDHNGLVDDVYGWNFAADNNNVDDWLGHGSHVAGIIAARINNAKGIAGIAPKTRLMALGVFTPPGFGTFADEIKAILYAVDQGAKVINLSLGGTAYSRGEQVAIEYAVQHGVVVVAAAGNNGREIYHWPAAQDASIAVAATTATDTLASFSNRGDYVDVAAPGVMIWSLRMGGGYRTMSGTSMATPHVSGLAALILARNPTLTPLEIRTIIQNTATDLGAPGKDTAFGYGRIDAYAALQATPPYTGTFPTLEPTWPPSQIWPQLCENITPSGNFEISGNWIFSGTATITDTIAASETHSLFLAGSPNQQGSASHLLTLPTDTEHATLAFNIRIENEDRDLGDDPADPGRDHLRAWFRTADGTPLLELLRAGNTNYDLTAGLPWDRYLHVLSRDEITLLRQQGQFQLWLYADNGPDPAPTRFFIDDIRFCIAHRPLHLPLILSHTTQ